MSDCVIHPKNNLQLRKLGNSYMIVEVSAENVNMSNVYTLNKTAADMWQLITEGEHTVSFRYENKAFSLGWKITLGCVVVLLAVAIPVYYPKLKPKKGKFEK